MSAALPAIAGRPPGQIGIVVRDPERRRGFSVLYRYPGEGVADLPALWAALAAGLDGRELPLALEGLDNRGDVRDQVDRLSSALQRLRRLVPAPAGA